MKNNYGLSFEEPILEIEKRIEDLRNSAESKNADVVDSICKLEQEKRKLQTETYANLSAWDRVRVARHPLRPVTADYLQFAFDDHMELCGDHHFADDKSIYTGFATIGEKRIMLVAHRKGKTTNDRIYYNFGYANPEGYRKAILRMKLAEKFGLPVVCIIDTPGANPDVGAEERGQAQAIAESMLVMARLRTPIVCIVSGEGGSGGAIAIGVGDRVCMLENAYYSVITPEGCAAILWKSGEKAEEAAKALRLTAKDLLGLGVIDEIIPEPLGGAHRDPQQTAANIRESISRNVSELESTPIADLLRGRYERHRRIGLFDEWHERGGDEA